MEDCIIAFLDILGFKQKVLGSAEAQSELQNLVASLNLLESIKGGEKQVFGEGLTSRKIEIRSRHFSDSWTIYLLERPEDIAHLFFVVRYIQDRLWERQICLRGGIVRGQMYWTGSRDDITLGAGLIDAYQLESSVAVYPRVVVSRDLQKFICENEIGCTPFGIRPDMKLEDFIRSDRDGEFYVDLLNPQVQRLKSEQLEQSGDRFTISFDACSPSSHLAVCENVRQLIDCNIASRDLCVVQKYQWLRSYIDTVSKV